MANLAYICIGATGHVTPSLAVAAELGRRGHRITYFLPERCHAQVSRTGARAAGYDSVFLREPPRRVDGFRGGSVPVHVASEIEVAVDSLVRGLRDARVDGALVDGYTHAGFLACDAAGVPCVRADTSYVTCDHFDYFEMVRRGLLRGELASPEALAEFDRRVAPVCARHGLAPATFRGLTGRRCPLGVVYVAREFHPCAERFAADTLFVGPCIDPSLRPRAPEGVAWPPRSPSRARVLVSFGSIFTYQPGFFDAVVEAIGRLEVDAIVAIGNHLPMELFEDGPPRVRVVRSIPQPELLEGADLFVCHGGMGGVMEALWFGVPVLVVPQYPEQLVSALRAEELGLGLHLDREDVSVSRLRAGIASLLADQSLRDNVRAFAGRMRADGGAPRAATAIEAHFSSIPSSIADR